MWVIFMAFGLTMNVMVAEVRTFEDSNFNWILRLLC